MSLLSIVIPAYNEADNISLATSRIKEILNDAEIPCEIVIVDDGSTDATWEVIEGVANLNENVTGLRLSRNFGKESAILAGLSNAMGSCAAVIDCDLQHPPNTLIKMYEVWKQGDIDIVEGVKQSRGKESAIYRNFSSLFYSLIERLGGISIRNSSDFQLLDRRIIDVIIRLPERQRFFRALTAWVGFNKVQIPFVVEPRQSGTSKFNFYSSLKYAIANLTSFSSAPLQIITITGFIFFVISIVLGANVLHSWIVNRAVEGFTTVILLLLIIGAMLMFSLGVIGIYLSKIYEEIKSRPSYLISEVIKNGELAQRKDVQWDFQGK